MALRKIKQQKYPCELFVYYRMKQFSDTILEIRPKIDKLFDFNYNFQNNEL